MVTADCKALLVYCARKIAIATIAWQQYWFWLLTGKVAGQRRCFDTSRILWMKHSNSACPLFALSCSTNRFGIGCFSNICHRNEKGTKGCVDITRFFIGNRHKMTGSNRYTRTHQFIFRASHATKGICYVAIIRFYVTPFARLLTSFINSSVVIVFAFIALRTSLITNTTAKTVLRPPFAATMMIYRSYVSSSQRGMSTLRRTFRTFEKRFGQRGLDPFLKFFRTLPLTHWWKCFALLRAFIDSIL